MASEKGPYILLSMYQSLYKDKYGKASNINKFREKWGMQDVIDSVGFEEAKDLLVYYFGLKKQGHPLQFFFYNFDKIASARNDAMIDKERRRLFLEETKKMVEEGGM